MEDIMSRDLENAVEALIDKQGLKAVLEAIENVCYGKAQHVEGAWQDVGLARAWERNGQVVGAACPKLKDTE
jgi:hypothetical protein